MMKDKKSIMCRNENEGCGFSLHDHFRPPKGGHGLYKLLAKNCSGGSGLDSSTTS